MKNPEANNAKLKEIVLKALSCASKVSVLILFLILFIGRINPARISEAIGTDVSLIKSAVYFKSLTKGIVALDTSDARFKGAGGGIAAAEDSAEAEAESGEDASASSASSGGELDFSEMSMEDIYAAMAAMVGEGFETQDTGSSVEWQGNIDYESETNSLKGVKIRVPKYGETWKAFAALHPEIAAAMSYDRTAAVLTLAAVLIAVAGVYLSCGTNKIRKAGYIAICAGGILAAASTANFGVAYKKLCAAPDLLNVSAMQPAGIGAIAAFGAASALLAAALFALEFVLKLGGKADAAAEKSAPAPSALSAQPFQVTYRLASLLAFMLLFIPGANPARISAKISRSTSLFTSGFFYKVYTDNLQYIFRRAWMPESVMRLSSVACLFVCLGIIACGIGACMTVGNNKLKRIGHFCLLGGSAVGFAFLFGILDAYNKLVAFGNLEKNLPLAPSTLVIFAAILLAIFVCTALAFVKTPAPQKGEKCHIEAPMQLFLMLLPFLLLIFVFSYLPLWGWRYAFFDYKAGEVLNMDKWVGFKWFAAPFTNPATRADVIRVLRNTLAMSGLGILTSWCPMIFAIFLSEIRNSAARRVIQTLTTIPNFISWVLVYAIAFCIFGTEGFINNLLVKNMHLMAQGRNYLMGSSGIWIKMLLWGMWKGLGWSAIMYIAAISGIDQQLYEAATVDGAGRFQKIWHITMPELIPTYIVLLILSISNILSNGMDQYLVFKNPDNKNMIEVLDLYVYQITLGTGGSGNNVPFSTVVSMFKSVVSVVLLLITNRISKWVRGTSIF